MKICEKCNIYVPHNSIYCLKCGNEIENRFELFLNILKRDFKEDDIIIECFKTNFKNELENGELKNDN